MTRVVNTVTIDGPIDTVFEGVTTTRTWPDWHPATVAVGGVTDRPIALGDTIHERARIGAQEYEGDWTVVEHERPTRVVMAVLGTATRISYAFVADARGATQFTRTLEFDPGEFAGSSADPGALERLMFAQSEAALAKLKTLIEHNQPGHDRAMTPDHAAPMVPTATLDGQSEVRMMGSAEERGAVSGSSGGCER